MITEERPENLFSALKHEQTHADVHIQHSIITFLNDHLFQEYSF